jgi:putative acetyltransferase
MVRVPESSLPAAQVRRFASDDEHGLWDVHRSAIECLASAHYTPEQIQAWLPAEHERVDWMARVRRLAPFVALQGERIVGYADLQADGLIDHFFVSGQHARRGVGTLLMRRLLTEAARLGLTELHAHVSLSAEAFFRRFGFEVIERRTPLRQGLPLANALMRTALPQCTASQEARP